MKTATITNYKNHHHNNISNNKTIATKKTKKNKNKLRQPPAQLLQTRSDYFEMLIAIRRDHRFPGK
jgi:hypothetical protein